MTIDNLSFDAQALIAASVENPQCKPAHGESESEQPEQGKPTADMQSNETSGIHDNHTPEQQASADSSNLAPNQQTANQQAVRSHQKPSCRAIAAFPLVDLALCLPVIKAGVKTAAKRKKASGTDNSDLLAHVHIKVSLPSNPATSSPSATTNPAYPDVRLTSTDGSNLMVIHPAQAWSNTLKKELDDTACPANGAGVVKEDAALIEHWQTAFAADTIVTNAQQLHAQRQEAKVTNPHVITLGLSSASAQEVVKLTAADKTPATRSTIGILSCPPARLWALVLHQSSNDTYWLAIQEAGKTKGKTSPAQDNQPGNNQSDQLTQPAPTIGMVIYPLSNLGQMNGLENLCHQATTATEIALEEYARFTGISAAEKEALIGVTPPELEIRPATLPTAVIETDAMMKKTNKYAELMQFATDRSFQINLWYSSADAINDNRPINTTNAVNTLIDAQQRAMMVTMPWSNEMVERVLKRNYSTND